MHPEIPRLPFWHPRLPSEAEKSKLFLYLLKLQYGSIDGLTEDQRASAFVSVYYNDKIAVYDSIKALMAWDDKRWGHIYSQIMFAMWSSYYDPSEPFYFDVFAFWHNGEEIHQLTPVSGFLQLEESLADIQIRTYVNEAGDTIRELGGGGAGGDDTENE
jgi:hypothetical protein